MTRDAGTAQGDATPGDTRKFLGRGPEFVPPKDVPAGNPRVYAAKLSGTRCLGTKIGKTEARGPTKFAGIYPPTQGGTW